MEKFCVSEREGVSHFSVENFLSHSTKKFRWGTLRCIGKFRVTKIFMHKRGRGYHISQSKTFCHTVPKNVVGEHFVVSENFGYRKILCIGEGVIEREREREKEGERERETERGGVSRFSVENFLSHSSDKIRRRTLLCFERFLVSNF